MTKYNDILLKQKIQKKKEGRDSKIFWLIFGILFSLFCVWSVISIFGDYDGLANNWQQNMGYIVDGAIHPELSLLWDMNPVTGIIPNVLATLCIGIIGTFFGILIAIPLAVKGSNNLNPKNANSYKKFFALLRTFPALIIALLMIIVVGPNAFAGTLAILISSVGMLGKMIAEVIEEMDMGIVEALESSGASKNQVIMRGVIPYIFSHLISISMYRLDINIREAITIGIVGAGGMGTPILLALQAQNWPRVFMWTYVTIIVVLIIEFISNVSRKKIR